jgi:error-prone DNA polymerase
MVAYAELAVTTNFSFLRGASHPHELVEQALELGLVGLGIADRNSVAGVVRAHVAAKEAGLKLAVGARLVFADGTPDILAYPRDRVAWARLTRLLSRGKLRADKGDCILKLEDAIDFIDGLNLIVMPPRRIDAVALKGLLERLREAATPQSLWLAASLLYRGDDARRTARLAEIATTARIPLIAVNDVLYHVPARRPLQDVVTCIREKTTLEFVGRRLEANAERHLKPAREMARLFRGAPQALAETVRFLRSCRFSLDDLKEEYPEERRAGFATPQDALAVFAQEGARRRYPNGVPPNVNEALARELAIIKELNYAPYFLTVHHIVEFARSLGILCQGRGSAANSVICYCLGVTEVDPIKVDLLFERFVSAERREPPDIDVDFEHERREEVIQHIYDHYGREHAGLAATVICYRGRSAIREVGKAFGLSEDTVGALAGTLWGWSANTTSADEVRSLGLDPSDPRLSKALALAQELVGFPRHLSQHVGGFVITRSRLDEVIPIENAAMEKRTVVEWDKDDLNDVGLLKVDVLGLGMLSCLRRALHLMKERYDLDYTLAGIPAEEAAVYHMLQRADSIGVFQVESRAQMSMLPRLRPKEFYDLVIEVAIVRPGPIQGDMVHPYLRRRQGVEPEVYPSPELRDILHKTLGVPLFQEHAMRIAIVAAGFAPAEADRLRRAMATFKRVGTIDLFRDKFINGMVERSYARDFAERCFRQIEGFGEYGFPESHAASFALLVYASAWIKCRYPDVFAAALLNSQPMGFYAPAQIVRDAQEHGVEVRPVDVNFSNWDCTLESPLPACGERSDRVSDPGEGDSLQALLLKQAPHPTPLPAKAGRGRPRSEHVAKNSNAIALAPQALHPRHAEMKPDIRATHAMRLGFRQISGFSQEDGIKIEQVRGAGFDSIRDLWLRTSLSPSKLERLAEADAFRSLGLDRRAALWAVRALRRVGDKDDLPLFIHASMPQLEPDVALPPMLLGAHVIEDYRHLHLSLKAHPVAFLRNDLAARGIMRHEQLPAVSSGRRVTVAGLVLVRQRPGSASGVIFMTLEDETGIANTIVWPKTFETFRPVVLGARLVSVTGLLQNESGVIHVVAERVVDLSPLLRRLSEEPDPVGTLHPGQDVQRLSAPRPLRHPRHEVKSLLDKMELTDVAPTEAAMPKGRNFH